MAFDKWGHDTQIRSCDHLILKAWAWHHHNTRSMSKNLVTLHLQKLVKRKVQTHCENGTCNWLPSVPITTPSPPLSLNLFSHEAARATATGFFNPHACIGPREYSKASERDRGVRSLGHFLVHRGCTFRRQEREHGHDIEYILPFES